MTHPCYKLWRLREDQQSFAACAFHPDLGNEVAVGRIILDRTALRFRSETVNREILLDRLELDLGESGGARIYFRDPAEPDWAIYTLDRRILEHPALLARTNTRNQIRAALSRKEFKRSLKLTAAFLCAVALLTWIGMVATGWMVRSLVAKIPPTWEKEFGDTMISMLHTNKVFVTDPKLLAQLNAVAAPLLSVVPTNGVEFKLEVIDNELPNAFALPGGHLIVHTGLLELADRPEEIAGVLAHEIAHVTERHAVRKVIASAGPALIFQIFLRGGGGLSSVLSGGSQLLIQQSFSQEYEMEADDKGWDYLAAAHIDPRGMIEIFRKLKAEEDRRKFPAGRLQAFSSHPATEKRIRRLEAKWRKLKNKSDFITLPKIDLDPQWTRGHSEGPQR